MGCVSSTFLEDDDRRIISASHVVSLTSSTYGILTTINGAAHADADDDPKSPPPPPPLPSRPLSRSTAPPDADAQPEVINSWELMAGLHDPSTPAKSKSPRSTCGSRTDKDANRDGRPPRSIRFPLRPLDGNTRPPPPPARQHEQQPAAVLYTTTLRGVRSTFEACNAVRAALQSHGVAFRERDVSMDRGFREELRGLLSATTRGVGGIIRVPRLFVRGRDVGGAEEVARLEEEGALGRILEGLPRARAVGGSCCDGCGGMRFLPCFECSGSRKVVVVLAAGGGVDGKTKRGRGVVVRCGECNENGLVLCPICS